MKRFSGFLIASMLVAAVIATGCATTTTASAQGATAFTGEVWTWSEQDNTITLRQGAQDIRVQVTPDQFIGLQLHSIRTIRGTLAPPKELPLVIVEGPSTVAPRGPADESEVVGSIAAVDPGGLTVNTPNGPVRVWRATDGLPFTAGANVRVRMRVQPLDIVMLRPGQTAVAMTTPAATIDPAASPRTEPGDYAVIMGRVLAVDPSGRLTVESARGPITVQVPNMTRYKVGDTVEVRTSVHPA
ncbi:MAG: hypothetical protein ACREKH_12965 [Candidatus Rokuibacteriota bacterium]